MNNDNIDKLAEEYTISKFGELDDFSDVAQAFKAGMIKAMVESANMSEANKSNNPMLELLKQHIENTPDFQLKAEFEQLKNSCADSPNAFEYIEALEKYYGNANKAVMWAVKDKGGNFKDIGLQKNEVMRKVAGQSWDTDSEAATKWHVHYAAKGWTIVPVEVREINDKNVSEI